MLIGERLRTLRESKKLSQGDIEKETGLLRCYTSRVEIGHTVPSIETLEKYAGALEVQMYQLFYEGEQPPNLTNLPKQKAMKEWGSSGKDARMLRRFQSSLGRMPENSRKLLLFMAQKMAGPATRLNKT